MVSFVDGVGKSGAHYAALYAQTNGIVAENVVTPGRLEEVLGQRADDEQYGVVIVDDIIGTGNTLVERMSGFDDVFVRAGVGTAVPLFVVVICGTVEGERRVRKYILNSMHNGDVEVCEIVQDAHFAFNGVEDKWESKSELAAAKTLVLDLGTRIQRRGLLGYKDQGLLLTFSRNCPNNTLPILHGSGKGGKSWIPLFPRSKT